MTQDLQKFLKHGFSLFLCLYIDECQSPLKMTLHVHGTGDLHGVMSTSRCAQTDVSIK